MSAFRFDDLAGRRIVLTGAAHGIGRELSRGLAQQGMRLVLIDRDDAPLAEHAEALRGAGAEVDAYACDLSEASARDALVQQLADYESIDAVMHNAAIDPRLSIDEWTTEHWRHVMATNVEPAVALAHGLLAPLRASSAGRVLLVGSIVFDLGVSTMSAYASSKGALVGLTRTLAHELGEDGITVNCIAPGAIQVEKEQHHPSSERDRTVIGWQSVKRRLGPSDLLGITCLLLSDAGGAISGQTIRVDGGFQHPLASAAFQAGVPGRDA